MARKVLIVDDEASIRSSLGGALKDESYDVFAVGSGEEALSYLVNQTYDAILLDVWMPGIDGIETLRRIRSQLPEQLVIVMSGHGNIETAVKATKLGAYDYIEKPLSLEKLLLALRNAFAFQELNQENQVLRSQVNASPQMIGNSKKMLALQEKIMAVAPLNTWVLITGENGTGKELVARAIHAGSKRKNKPFVAVNCAAIPEELIESELFGHEKGAFTGATQMKRGRFEEANGGTLFLDEIADMSLKTQAKILRILQEQKFERVGANSSIDVDVRVLAATNKNLPEAIKNNQFREDLYYRLNVVPLIVPALRERTEDLGALFKFYFEQFSREQGREAKVLSEDTTKLLKHYPWPGNVRELKNLAERLSIMAPSKSVSPDELPEEVLELAMANLPASLSNAQNPGDLNSFFAGERGLKEAKSLFEREFIIRRLKENDWNVSRTSQILGIERAHLHRKMKAYRIGEEREE